MGDGVTAAMAPGQKTPDGYYKLDRMLGAVTRHAGHILCCGTCIGRPRHHRLEGMLAERPCPRWTSSATTLAADKVLVF